MNRLKKFLNYPESLSFRKIENLLLKLGFIKIQAKGSHLKFKHQKIKNDLIVPIHGNDCKKFYKKLIAKIIKDEIIG